jgi:hypothetical protein
MKRFIGVKLINAKPMTRLAYNEFRGWDLPADENGDDKGFLVEYVEGGKPNTKEYEGYVSWSPEDVFHGAYTKTTSYDSGLSMHVVSEGYQERVCDEYDALHGNIKKLEAYLEKSSDDLLSKQLNYMIGYAVILGERIEGFKID